MPNPRHRFASRHAQRGLSMWQLAYVLGSLAIFGIVGTKALPLWLDHLKVERAVKKTASTGYADPQAVLSDLYRIWAIEDIKYLDPKDVKLKRVENGAALVYSYDATVQLFGNASLVMHYEGNERVAPSAN